jgi:hypothetical protein
MNAERAASETGTSPTDGMPETTIALISLELGHPSGSRWTCPNATDCCCADNGATQQMAAERRSSLRDSLGIVMLLDSSL